MRQHDKSIVESQMTLTLCRNEQNHCCLCLPWIPICIFKESPHCQDLSSAMSWIVHAWKITNQMFCSLRWSFAIIFFALSTIWSFLKTVPRLWLCYLLQESLLAASLAPQPHFGTSHYILIVFKINLLVSQVPYE